MTRDDLVSFLKDFGTTIVAIVFGLYLVWELIKAVSK